MVKRPALRYYGGKWNLAPWIISHFPRHEHYVEPCFGAGSVLLRKPQVKLETVNDTNDRIVNYFAMLRDHPEELIAKIDLTPWAYTEYQRAQMPSIDPLEDARRFHILCWMSIRGGPTAQGFRVSNKASGRHNTHPSDILHHDLTAVSQRLRGVQILCEDGVDMLKRYHDSPDTLVYFDPPYVHEMRTVKDGYGEHEVVYGWHKKAADVLRSLPCFVVVSGYKNRMYVMLYEEYGWIRYDCDSRTNSGTSRTESIWLSPRTQAALNDLSLLPLFKELV